MTMGYHTGYNRRKIKTYNRAEFIMRCAQAADDGYELHKRSKKRDWPRFWRHKFKAEYRKYYIIDDSKIAFFHKKQIEYIKTGDPRKLYD